jgi:hypothetical protein
MRPKVIARRDLPSKLVQRDFGNWLVGVGILFCQDFHYDFNPGAYCTVSAVLQRFEHFFSRMPQSAHGAADFTIWMNQARDPLTFGSTCTELRIRGVHKDRMDHQRQWPCISRHPRIRVCRIVRVSTARFRALEPRTRSQCAPCLSNTAGSVRNKIRRSVAAD